MSLLPNNKSIVNKLIRNLVDFAIFHDADAIHLIKSLADESIIEVRYLGREIGNRWFLPEAYGESLWLKLSALLDNGAYFLVNNADAPIHCRIERFLGDDEHKIIINLTKHNQDVAWSNAQFDSVVADKVLEDMRSARGLAILTGADHAFTAGLAYVLLAGLADENLCLASLEDPIMGDAPSVNQCQATAGVNYQQTFEQLLRQDVDVIYLSDLAKIDRHRLSAVAGNKLILGRLVGQSVIDILKSLLASTDGRQLINNLKFILDVYLVKRNCPHCLSDDKISATDLQRLATITGLSTKDIAAVNFAHSIGCEQCAWSGYHGQIPLYDGLFLDEELRQTLLTKNLTDQTIAMINDQMALNAMEDGWVKATIRLISYREILEQFKA